MGIRESFEKDPSGEELNIRDIVIEDKKREILPFNPEVEILDEDWKAMRDALEVERENGHKEGRWQKFFRLAVNMKIIFPERGEELKLDTEIRQALIEIWSRPDDKNPGMDMVGDSISRFEYAADMKILFPDFDLNILYTPEIIKKMQSMVKEQYTNYDFAVVVSKMAIAFPEAVKELGLDEKTWQAQKKILESCRQNRKWFMFIPRASGLKIIFPKKAKELDLDEEAWNGMRGELQKWRSGSVVWDQFAKLAAHMKILSAYEVKITDSGIECAMHPPEDFREPKKPRPERRQF